MAEIQKPQGASHWKVKLIMKTKKRVNAYLSGGERQWRNEMAKLRKIILEFGLTEELKWGKPCYTLQQCNVFILQGFKQYCALMFCKGALLKDPKNILIKPGEHTQGARQIRFTNVREMVEMETVLKAYIHEAIEVQRAGLKVDYKKNPEPIPEELQNQLDKISALRIAFNALTPGRQRAYILYFSAPKQSKTRASRIKKCKPLIINGKGLND